MDREKVIRGIDICLNRFHCGADCPYYDNSGCQEQLRDDALALLRKQETATVISIHRNGFGSRVGACPNCQRILHYEYNQSFCGKCGQELKWE